MSALLSQLEGRERAAECARNEAAMGIHPVFASALAPFSPAGQQTIRDAQRAAYVKALRSMDWSHEFSDDHSRYTAGREALAQLKVAQRELDPEFALWDQHCHPNCKGGRAYL